jgi:hypothetical protein
MKCPLMTAYDLDCVEGCGNVTCKHQRGGNKMSCKIAKKDMKKVVSKKSGKK